MNLALPDIIVFVAFFAVLIGVSLFKSRKETNSEDYFLGVWLIGIIAALYTTWGGLKASRHANSKGDHAYG